MCATSQHRLCNAPTTQSALQQLTSAVIAKQFLSTSTKCKIASIIVNDNHSENDHSDKAEEGQSIVCINFIRFPCYCFKLDFKLNTCSRRECYVSCKYYNNIANSNNISAHNSNNIVAYTSLATTVQLLDTRPAHAGAAAFIETQVLCKVCGEVLFLVLLKFVQLLVALCEDTCLPRSTTLNVANTRKSDSNNILLKIYKIFYDIVNFMCDQSVEERNFNTFNCYDGPKLVCLASRSCHNRSRVDHVLKASSGKGEQSSSREIRSSSPSPVTNNNNISKYYYSTRNSTTQMESKNSEVGSSNLSTSTTRLVASSSTTTISATTATDDTVAAAISPCDREVTTPDLLSSSSAVASPATSEKSVGRSSRSSNAGTATVVVATPTRSTRSSKDANTESPTATRHANVLGSKNLVAKVVLVQASSVMANTRSASNSPSR